MSKNENYINVSEEPMRPSKDSLGTVHGSQIGEISCANPLCSKSFKRNNKTKEYCSMPCHDSFHKICREIGFKVLTTGLCTKCFGRKKICTGIMKGKENLIVCPTCSGIGTNIKSLKKLPEYLMQYLSSGILGSVNSITITFSNSLEGIKLISNTKEKS